LQLELAERMGTAARRKVFALLRCSCHSGLQPVAKRTVTGKKNWFFSTVPFLRHVGLELKVFLHNAMAARRTEFRCRSYSREVSEKQ